MSGWRGWRGADEASLRRGGVATAGPARGARPAQKPGRMNKTEQAYADQILEPLRLAGEIRSYKFEALKFRLAPKTFYTPDFLVEFPGHLEIHEVKGHWEDDARVKIKVAAELFPMFRFKAVKRDGGHWPEECFG